MKRVMLLFALAVLPLALAADEKELDPALAAMAVVPDLTGEWEGEGWIRMGPGDPMPFIGQEIVEPYLGGRVLVIQGKHWTPDRSRMVHDAFAVLSYDETSDGLRFRTQVVGRGSGDHKAYVKDGALVWEMSGPRQSRFVIKVEDGQWIETGETLVDGQWRQFFQMKLKRK